MYGCYDGPFGTNTLNTLLWGQQYLNDYNFLQNQYQCNSPIQSILNQQAQQCCSISDIMNRWQASSLQSQVNSINKFFGYNNDNNKTNEENTKTKYYNMIICIRNFFMNQN